MTEEQSGARWLDASAAPAGSTVWVVWDASPGSNLAPATVAATHQDGIDWAADQPDPTIYAFTEWRVIGSGWPCGGTSK